MSSISMRIVSSLVWLHNQALTNVSLPTSLVVISEGAFEQCFTLQTIIIPTSVTYIGVSAFNLDSALVNVVLPTSILILDQFAFYYCTSINNLIIPTSVTILGDGCFSDNLALANLTLPTSLVVISNNTFKNTVFSTLIIPTSVTYLGQGAFENNGVLQSLILPTSLTTIAVSAFIQSFSLQNVVLSTSVVQIKAYAFQGCSIYTIVIPTSVVSIGSYAFNDNPLLTVLLTTSVTYFGVDAFPTGCSLVYVTVPPSLAPSSIPTYAPSSALPYSISFVVVLAIPGIFYILTGLALLLLRSSKSLSLNPIHADHIEVADLLVRGTFLSVLFIKAVVSFGHYNHVAVILFAIVRALTALLWVVFVFKLSRQPGASRSMEYTRRAIHLSKMIKYEVLSSSFRVAIFSMATVFGMLDLSILRLLPWLPTEFSVYINGYPNLFAFRCCVYGGLVAFLLQSVACTLLFTGNQDKADLTMSIILIILSISLLLKALVEFVLGVQKERTLEMVTVLERDNKLLRSTLANKENRESTVTDLQGVEAAIRYPGIKAADEWSTANPLNMSVANNTRPSVAADVIFVPQSDAPDADNVSDQVSTHLPYRTDFSQECLVAMRGFVPPHIFSASLASLVGADGLSEPLAKRLLSKKCLWLVRMDPQDIQKLSEDAFKSRFNPQGQQLDIVELMAVFACIPATFMDDPGYRKATWRSEVLSSLQYMVRMKDAGQLYGSDMRHAVYKGQQPLFQLEKGLHRMMMNDVDEQSSKV
eukprot:gene22267-28838_t